MLSCRSLLGFAALCAALLLWGCAAGLIPDDAVPMDQWGRQAPPDAADGPLMILTDPGELPELRIAGEEEQRLPLEHTHVSGQLTGYVAEVEVKQTYSNPHPEPIEVVYIFPLPENSAVNHMEMVVGERVITAQIREKQHARRIYQRAKSAGYTAALLEQERPNVFTQSVANIEPGKQIDVVIRYVQDLTYDAGQYELVFPLVVGPRFIPGAEREGPPSGTGTYQDTAAVPDASRITPPYLGKGQRSGHDISLELTVNAGLPIYDLQTPTHEVHTEKHAGGVTLTLARKDSIPNRDFVLRYRVADEQPRATLLTSTDQGAGYFSLVVHPPRLPVDVLVGRREIIFVVDVSGSMSGEPLALCQEAMREAIFQLRPVDTFNIITFSGSTGQAFTAPRPVNRTTVEEALEFVQKMSAGGGTYMANAIEAALGSEVGEGRHRYVFFLTDGEVGNEEEIFAGAEELVERLEQRGQRARVFGFGVGSSPNRHLLDGLSRAGKGITVYASGREDPAAAVNRFYHYIDRAVVVDLDLDPGTLGAAEIFPAKLPDLFASRPIIVHGRYRTPPRDGLVISGKVGSQSVEIPVTVHRRVAGLTNGAGVLGTLWARAKVASLEQQLWRGPSQSVQEAITQLGLDHRLVTRFTSFVAVDRSKRVSDGNPHTIVQPVEVPEGVDPTMAGARSQPLTPGVPAADAPQPGYGPAQPPAVAGADEPTVTPVTPAAAPPPAPGAGETADEDGEPEEEADISDEELAEMHEEEPREVAMEMYAVQQIGPSDRGCYCRTTTPRPGGSSGRWWLLALLAGAAACRRRRASRKRHSPRGRVVPREV